MSRRSVCIRATTASCSTRWIGSPPKAIRCSSWSMTRTRFGAPTTSSIWDPAPAPRRRVVGAGTAEQLERSPDSVTGRLLANPLKHPLGTRRVVSARTPALLVRGASLHNLRNQTFRVPLGRLVVVTGVSGSGKSTVARDILHDNLRAALSRRKGAKLQWRGCREISGWEQVERILEVDQTPIGKTPRSCPATYVGFWDAIRRVFAETPGSADARLRARALFVQYRRRAL